MQILLFWKDSYANRFVKFSVDYSIEQDRLSVFDVQPLELSPLASDGQTIVTRMKIRDPDACDMLRTQFLDANCLNSLVKKIADHHQLALV